MKKKNRKFTYFIKKFYLEILIFISSIILISLVEDRYALTQQIKVIGKRNAIHDIHQKENPVCTEGKTLNELIEETYKKSKILLYREYKQEFYKLNQDHFKYHVCIGNSIIKIPEYNPNPMINQPLNENIPRKGIYIRWDLASIDNIVSLVQKIKGTEINALVIDAKDIVGVLTYKSNDPIVKKYQPYAPIIKDFPKLVDFLHKNRIYIIVRLALFQDMNLIKHRKDLAIYNPNTLSKTIEYKGQPIWVDPAKEEVQDYNLRILKELISFGVDEVQFDYIRYPAEGNLDKVEYYKVKHSNDKIQHLINFLFKAWMIAYPTSTRLSIDVFGITAWQERKDIETTGQDLSKLSVWIDWISPMLYPSHFGLFFENLQNPADYPEYFYKKGIEKIKNLVPEHVKIRPWIQAFKWRVSNYNQTYIKRQIQTIEENQGHGWLMWNAANDYDIALKAIKNN
ncbi:MAG: putative glycoside hydrolase [Leptonema sp. (in: bacteria)]